MRTLTKYTSAAGSEARSRPRTLLLCLNTQGRLIIMNYGNTRYLSPFSSPIAPPSGVLLARPRTSFIFLPGLATLTPGFKSTVRYRSCLLRAKVRQLHQFSLRGSTRYRTGTVLEYIDLLAKTKTLKSQHTLYTRTGYIPEYTEVYGEGTRTWERTSLRVGPLQSL